MMAPLKNFFQVLYFIPQKFLTRFYSFFNGGTVELESVNQQLLQEIRERRAAEAQVEKLNQELAKLNELKREFTSMVTHELRTPLGVIKEGLNLIFDGIEGPVTESQKETLEIALNNVDRLARMINNVLDFEKLNVGVLVMSCRETDIKDVILEVFQFMKPSVDKKKIDFDLELPASEIRALCDPDKIKQVLINLIHNAVKFTEESGRITVRLLEMGPYLQLEVQDTGVGIYPEDQEKIFELFSQAPYQGMWKTGGSGVGLAVCKKIVEKHGGTIQVASLYGQGSRFIVTFPSSLSKPA